MAEIPWDALMDAAGDSDFAPIPQGDYDVKITATEATTSSTDKPMWKITTEIEDGPHASRKVWTQQTLTMDNSNALQVFFRQMAAAGLTQDFFRAKPSPQQIAEALLGRRFRAKIAIKEWNGQMRNEIKNWAPPGLSAGAPPAAGAAPRPGGPPPPGAAAAPSAPPAPAPATSTAPPAAPPTPAPAPAPAAAAPPAPPPAPAAPAAPAEPAPVTASVTPPADPSAWVVQETQTGSTEPPPF